MAEPREDPDLIRYALAYVDELYRELTEENGAAPLGPQNQAVDFMLADPELRAAAAHWGRLVERVEDRGGPPRRLPQDEVYRRMRAQLEAALPPPAFVAGRPA